MTHLRKIQSSPKSAKRVMSESFNSLITYFVVFLVLCGATTHVNAQSKMVVSRNSKGDDFTNPHLSTHGQRSCAGFNALCVEDLLKSCGECRCNPGNETYRFDIKKCVSSEELQTYSRCLYKGLKDHRTALLDERLTTLDLTKGSVKNIQGPLGIPERLDITCHIANTSGFLNRSGEWTPLSKFANALRIDVSRDATASVKRYLNLNWEGVSDYSGLLIKLDIVCNSANGVDSERNCLLFKTTGRHTVVLEGNKPTLITTTGFSSDQTDLAPHSKTKEKTPPTSPFKRDIRSTTKTFEKTHTYSFPMSIIIGISAGVAIVILIIIVLAVYCVRSRLRKLQEPKQAANISEAPKVHFTAQTRFSLIRESAQIEELEPYPGDYACLQDSRESYDPYYALRKDDVDLNVIDQVLKEAISMESVKPSSEPRYSYRLSGDQTVIQTAPPRSPQIPKYHVLEDQGEVNEPDYEEMETSDEEDLTEVARRLETKPPLPDREYHVLEPPVTTAAVYSDC